MFVITVLLLAVSLSTAGDNLEIQIIRRARIFRSSF